MERMSSCPLLRAVCVRRGYQKTASCWYAIPPLRLRAFQQAIQELHIASASPIVAPAVTGKPNTAWNSGPLGPERAGQSLSPLSECRLPAVLLLLVCRSPFPEAERAQSEQPARLLFQPLKSLAEV